MRYIVIIYYVLIEGEQIFETLNVNKNIEANSPEEAIGIAYNLLKPKLRTNATLYPSYPTQ